MEHEESPLNHRLREEILLARERVYRFGAATPLEQLQLPGPGPEIWVKREDLSAVKLPEDPASWAVHLASLAQKSGLDGVVCSAREVASIKEATGTDFKAVTPGIRLPEAGQDDQRRVTTPSEAIGAGSDYLVIGRPIVQADDPVKALEKIQAS